MGAIELVEKSQLAERPAMKAGDTVKVHVKVREGDKGAFRSSGVVIGLHRGGTRASFTVRKVSFGQVSNGSSRCTRRRFREVEVSEGRPRSARYSFPARAQGQGEDEGQFE
jgi:large subunit ribosomal protein L19